VSTRTKAWKHIGLAVACSVLAGGLATRDPMLAHAATTPDKNRLYIVDGDTYRWYGITHRILNLDAPELHSPQCDEERIAAMRATVRLSDIMGAGFTQEDQGRPDKYGRTLSLVRDAHGVEIAKTLIKEGLGREYHGGHREGWCK
jgi:micrococcal nuclease